MLWVIRIWRPFTNCNIIIVFLRVGKEIAPSDPAPQDLNLNSDLFTLWGVRVNDSVPGMLITHGRGPGNVPAASLEQINIAGVNVDPPVSKHSAYSKKFLWEKT